MPLYEHVFMTRQDVSSQQIDQLTSEFSKIIEEGGGKIARSEYWGLRPLAYKIKKNRKAHYTMLNIDSPHEAVAEMERRMSLSTDVLRYMTVRVNEHEADQSVMMRKSDRDDRRGGRGDRPPFRRDQDGSGGRPDSGRKFEASKKPDDAPRPEVKDDSPPAEAPAGAPADVAKETD